MSQNDAAKLKPGDIVVLKKGGYKFTVTSVEPSGRVVYGTVGNGASLTKLTLKNTEVRKEVK